jgi:peroxiredoxin Q/BCP
LTPAGSQAVKEGDRAPDFQALTDDQSPISLTGFRGKNVILYFFPKANTPG